MFRKVLVANRGEIAVRIIRALRELKIASVALYSDADRSALHVRMADEASYAGPSDARESYLSISRILDAARSHGADAIHPGYGFLSENAAFAAACKAAGIVFIGPSPEAIAAMGSKTEARRLAQDAGVPVIPGGPASAAAQAGYPLIVKAAAGGGGKGMRVVMGERELAPALRDASSEAERAFGDGEVYVEKLISRPRHVEIQILGDHHGRLIHLGERECSIQRRHQKVMEECPAPLPIRRDEMGEAALRVAAAAGYFNAGTVEFLVDEAGGYYFLEMNTRLQVEHPVTELVTGIDLVHWQLRIAAGEALTVSQQDIEWRGAAVECRIYAEDPDNNFVPSPGKIVRFGAPSGPGVRLDSGVYSGWTVPLEYDPLLAKLAVWAPDRAAALSRMERALLETYVDGIGSNVPLFRELLRDPEMQAGRLHTGFLEEYCVRSPGTNIDETELLAAAMAAAAVRSTNSPSPERRAMSRWKAEGLSELLR